MKKKIIFVTRALWIGGIETALVNLLNRLDPLKYDITCLILQDEKPMAERLPGNCRLLVADREHTVSYHEAYRFSRLIHLTEETETPSGLHRAMMWLIPAIKWVENRLYIRYVRRQLKGERFDTCIIYSDVAAETAVRAVNAERFLMFYHHGAMRHVYHDEIGYRKCEKILAVSRNQEEKLRRFCPRYAYKMRTVENITDIAVILAGSRQPIPEHHSREQYHIVTCGRIAKEKGMDLAVEACAKLVAAGQNRIHWWIEGGGPAEEEVRGKIRQLGMEQHVTMLGMKENPYPYIAAADLYVLPSRVESFGLTIAEALILGRYVVSTETDGAREMLTDPAMGRLCPVDAESLAQEILAVMQEKPQGILDIARRFEKENQNRLSKFDALMGD